jgi:DNA-binding XRE family transcriptional regulator
MRRQGLGWWLRPIFGVYSTTLNQIEEEKNKPALTSLAKIVNLRVGTGAAPRGAIRPLEGIFSRFVLILSVSSSWEPGQDG